MFVKLASLPTARNGQVPASAITRRFNVDTNELEIDTSSDIRAYFVMQNLTSYNLRYYYTQGDDSESFTILPKAGIRIVNRQAIYVKLESGSGEICIDRGEG